MDSLKESIQRWFIQGQVGVSSRAMASAIIDVPLTGNDKHHNHPHDPDDLNRCLLFLEAVPEAREHLDKVRKLSPEWDRLIENWEKIEKTFLDEVGLNWCNGSIATQTYNLMQSIIRRTEG